MASGLTISSGGAAITGNSSVVGTFNAGSAAQFAIDASGNVTTSGSHTQSGSGANTFSGASSFTAAGTALSVTNNATISGNLTVPTVYGSSSSAGTLTLASTSNATKGKINFGANSAYDEANIRLGIRTTSPTQALQVSSGSLNFTKVTTPTAPSGVDAGAGGSLSAGNYKYEVTYVNDSGETLPSSASANVAVSASHQVTVTIPTSADVSVTARKIYRTQVGGSSYTYLATVANNSSTTYTDGTSDASIAGTAVPPGQNTTGGSIMLAGSPVFMTDSTSQNLTLGLSALNNVTTGTYNVALGGNALLANTSGGYNTAVGYDAGTGNQTGSFNSTLGTNAGPSSNISGGYNTAIGSFSLYFNVYGSYNTAQGAYALANSVATSNSTALGAYTDYVHPGAGLSAVASVGAGLNTGLYQYHVTFVLNGSSETTPDVVPTQVTTTGGNSQVALTNIPTYNGSFSAQRRIYRTAVGGGGSYYLVTTIANNTTTSYTDTLADATLTTNATMPSTGGSIILGSGANAEFSNQLVIGSSSAPITDAYLGQGIYAASPSATTIHATGGQGSNVAGANLVLAPGQGTGTAVGGDFIVQTASGGVSGSTFNPLSERLRVSNAGLTSVTGTFSVSSTSTFSSTLTASNGLTLTTGALNLTATSGALSLSGLSASSINTGGNNLTVTSGNFNTTATGINNTAIGATTASTGAFTTLSSTQGTSLATSSGNTAIGNGSGTFAVTSTGLNVTTAGALSGITTISTSSTINSQTIGVASSFTGTVAVATSLSVPLLQTASGQLAIQAATGVVALNTSGVNNVLKVFGTGSTNYAQITDDGTNAQISTNSGELQLAGGNGSNNVTIGDVGSAANLIFQESSTIGTSGSKTLTFGLSGDTFNLNQTGVTYNVGTLTSTGVTLNTSSTSTTALVVNGPAGMGANLLDLQVNGSSAFNVTSGGSIGKVAGITASGQITNSNTGANALALTGAPAASATSSLLQLGSAIASGSGSGTFIGVNAANAYAGDLVNLQVNGTAVFKIAASGAVTNSAAGAASVPAELLNGAILTGGTGTTNFPQFLLQPTGATATTTWSTNGTALGVNTSAFTGNLADWRVNGTQEFKVDASGNLTLAGGITVASTGSDGYLSRAGTTLQPTTAGDAFTTSGNISATGSGTITAAGLLTASNGFTVTTGALNVTATSGALALSGLSASSISTGASNLTITAGNFNTTATGINNTAIGATTASTGAFTTVTTSSTINSQTISSTANFTGTVTIATSATIPTVQGSTSSAGTLTLSSTSNGTKGKINFGSNSAYDEANIRLGIGTQSPSQSLQVADGNLNFTQVSAPTAPTLADLNNGLGALSAGVYKYEVTYVNAYGETVVGTASSGVTVSLNDQVTVTIPVSADATVTSRKIYRTQVNGSSYTLLTTVANNSGTTYTDGASDASISATATPPNDNTTGGEVMLAGSPVILAGASNTVLGQTGFMSTNTAASSVAIGFQALNANTSGNRNTAVGYQALRNNTTGGLNTGIGYGALLGNTTGAQNTAIGQKALNANTTGTNNAGLGYISLVNTTTGTGNTGAGSGALQSVNISGNNVAVGNNADILVPASTFTATPTANATGLSAGVYGYLVTFVLGGTETAPNATAVTATTSAGNLQVNLASIPTYTGPYVATRKIYRSTVGTTTYKLLTTLGDNTTTTYNDTTADGSLGATISSNLGSNNILLGVTSASIFSNQMVIGSSTASITDAYLGKGIYAASPTAITLHATGGSGTDIAGANLVLAGGQGTGAGVGGDLIVQTAAAGSTGSTFNSLSERLRVSTAGLTSVTGTFSVSSTSVFSGAVSVTGGINNNSGGVTNTGSLAGVTTLALNNSITQSGSNANTLTGATTFSGGVTNSTAGAASTPAEVLTGAIFTGGSGTTTFPQFLIQPTGATAATNWSTNGTAIGVNAHTFTGDLMNLKVDGTTEFSVAASGNTTITGNLTVNGSGTHTFAGTIQVSTLTSSGALAISSASNGNISISPNGSGNLNLTLSTGKVTLGDGGTTNYSAFSNNGALTFNGAARPYSEITLDPTNAVVPASNNCVINQTDDGTSGTSYKTVDCPISVDDSATWTFKMPQNYVNSSNVQVDVYWMDTASNSANSARFDVGYTAVPSGSTFAGATRTDVTGSSVASAGQNKLTNSTITLTAPSISADNLVSLRVLRKGTVDNLPDTAKIVNVRIKFIVGS